MDKSRSTQITETEDKVKTIHRSTYISSDSFSDKSTRIEKPKEIDIRKDNTGLSSMSGHGTIVSSESPDKQCITCKNKIRNTSDTSIRGKESIQEPDKPSKRSK